jgi:hypothetical protein
MARFLLRPLLAALLIGAFIHPSFANLVDRAKDLLIEHEVKVSHDQNLFESDWFNVRGKYTVGFKKHHNDIEKYYRYEQLDFSALLRESLGGHVSASFGPSAQASFIRPFYRDDLFKRKTDDGFMVSLYTPFAAPHTAEKAKELREGEYYIFTARLGFGISASDAMATGIAFAGPRAGYALAGDFRLQVYVLGNNRVRVTASSLNERSLNIGGSIRLVPDIDVFSFDKANDLVNDTLEVTAFDWTAYSSSKGSLYSIEFTYDLDAPEAEAAYNQLMDISEYKFRDFRVLNPIRNHQGEVIRRILAGKILDSERAALQAGSGVDKGTVSSASFERQGNSLGVDVHLADYRQSKNYLEMDYTATRGTDPTVHRYKIASLQMLKDYKVFINWKEADQTREATMIFKLNEAQEITSFEEMNVGYRRADVTFKSENCENLCQVAPFLLRQNEFPGVIGHVRKIIPPEWFEQYQIYARMTHAVGREMLLNIDIYYGPKALEIIQNLSANDIELIVEGYHYMYKLNKVPSDANQRRGGRSYYGLPHPRTGTNNVRRISEKMVDLFLGGNSAAEIQARWEELKGLNNNRNFRTAFSGLIPRLLEMAVIRNGQTKLEDIMSVHFNLQIKDRDNHVLKMGNYESSEFNRSLIRDRNRVLNRNFNPSYFDD